MSADPGTVTLIARALKHHRRLISQTGAGVRCECGKHYANPHTWRHHLARVATQALKANP